jgi:chemotaxis protein CheD
MSVVHSIGIAGLKVVRAPDMVRTVLGSCVGVALFDCAAKVGGMVHVILPCSKQGQGDKGKFADTAVDWLVDEVIRDGALRQRLTAKIGGGASMFGAHVDNGIGARNIQAVRERLAHHHIRLAAEAVGGLKGRKMTLDPTSGKVEIQLIGASPEIL